LIQYLNNQYFFFINYEISNRVNEFSRISNELDNLSIELNELRRQKKANVNTSKLSTTIRGKFQTILNSLSSLDDNLHSLRGSQAM